MKSFLIVFQVVLFFVVMNQRIEAVYVEKNCGPNDSNCQEYPSNEAQGENISQNVTCEQIEEWFHSSNSTNQKWIVNVWSASVSTATKPGGGGLIAHRGHLGQVKDQLSLPSYWFKEVIQQTDAKWNGKNYYIEWNSYPEFSVDINSKVTLVYGHKILTSYDTQARQTILNIVDNKSLYEFYLGLPSKCVTNFDPEKFEEQSNSPANQEEPNWNNENDSLPEKETKKAPPKKRGRKNKEKKEMKVTHHCVGSKC